MRRAVPWVFVYMLSVVVLISATRAARDCLLHRQSSGITSVRLGVVDRLGAPFWGLYCQRANAGSLRPTVY
jgi:hypothetical protein